MDPNQESIPTMAPQTSDHLTVCILASGSKGNAILVADQQIRVLFDAGLSGIEIERRCKSKGFHPDQLDAIIVSHEHSDHIQGVGVLARRFDLPVYISKRTGQSAGSMLGKIADLRYFKCGSPFSVDTWIISPFSISHDAEDPAGFTIHNNGMKIGIATDLGVVTAMVRERLKACQILILEANHDPEMLINGPYPWPLKQRIQSRTGHLSNEASRELVSTLKHKGLQHVVLAHLSETNNTPEKALQAVGLALDDCDAQLHVATQDVCAEILQIQGAEGSRVIQGSEIQAVSHKL
jgi:phosphoribosyl 1,2-cyclic phosphodiesterase